MDLAYPWVLTILALSWMMTTNAMPLLGNDAESTFSCSDAILKVLHLIVVIMVRVKKVTQLICLAANGLLHLCEQRLCCQHWFFSTVLGITAVT